jgi:UDP-glucose 4-epimerase
MAKSKSAFVTGGFGYLGSHLCKMLIENGWTVSVFDIKKPTHPYWNHSFCGDVCNKKELTHSFWLAPDVDVVFHLAGLIDIAESVSFPSKYFLNNAAGTSVVLEVMRNFKVDKIIYSSTAGLYRSSEEPLTEKSPLNPDNNPYAASKYCSEISIRNSDIKHVIFRYFNLAGADESGLIGEDHEPETHLIPKILQNLNMIKIYGNDYNTPDGTCIRDYVHVNDVSTAHLKAAEYLFEGKDSITMNLGTGKGQSVLEVVNKVKELTKENIKINFHSRRPGDPPRLVADISLAEQTIQYQPKYTLTDIIQTARLWHKNEKG